MNRLPTVFLPCISMALVMLSFGCPKEGTNKEIPPKAPAAEDASKKKMEKAAEEPAKKSAEMAEEKPAEEPVEEKAKTPCQMVGMTEPLDVERASLFRDGGSVEAEIKDAAGNIYKVHLNNKLKDPERGTVTLDDAKLEPDMVKALRECVKQVRPKVAEDIFQKKAIEGFLNPAP